MRIQKYLSERNIMSRREAEKAMLAGHILLNGSPVRDLGRQIDPTKDKVEVKASANLIKKTTVIIWKPKGIASSKTETNKKSVFDLFPLFNRLNTVGGLDTDAEGLLILSDDGVITSLVTDNEHRVEKEYEVSVRENILGWMVDKMKLGIELPDGKTLPANVKLLDKTNFSIALLDGRKNQIKRMMADLNLTVERVTRTRIGTLTLKGIKQGGFKILTETEVDKLKTSLS